MHVYTSERQCIFEFCAQYGASRATKNIQIRFAFLTCCKCCEIYFFIEVWRSELMLVINVFMKTENQLSIAPKAGTWSCQKVDILSKILHKDIAEMYPLCKLVTSAMQGIYCIKHTVTRRQRGTTESEYRRVKCIFLLQVHRNSNCIWHNSDSSTPYT